MIRRVSRFVGKGKVWAAAFMAAVICTAVASIPSVEAAGDSDVVKVRLGGDANATRVVIDLGKSVKGELISRDTDYGKAVLGLSGVSLPKALSGEGRGLVAGWKIDSTAGMTRVRLDFKGEARVSKRFLLPPSDGISNYRYVIDIVPKDGASAPVAKPQVVKANPTVPDAKTVLADKKTRTKKVIVIDAGHGGHDPGASGSFSIEKDVNLAAARVLKARLEATGRYRVIMTRDTDAYVDKVARVRIARNANADLFISLHSDSGPNKATRGASIYTLSDSGTERAAKNAMNRGDWALAMQPVDKIVGRILVDLTQRATKNRSATFAELLLDRLEGTTPLLKSGHRQAGFVVLLAADVPAILLEMGFISNAEDEKMLNDSNARGKMMTQVVKAIDQYFENDVAYASFALLP